MRSLQSSVDLFLTETCDLHDFGAGALASENFELGRREIKKVGQEFEAGGVRRTLHRRRRQSNVQDVSGPAGDRVTRGSWLDADGEGDVSPGNPLTGCG